MTNFGIDNVYELAEYIEAQAKSLTPEESDLARIKSKIENGRTSILAEGLVTVATSDGGAVEVRAQQILTKVQDVDAYHLTTRHLDHPHRDEPVPVIITRGADYDGRLVEVSTSLIALGIGQVIANRG